MMILVAGMMFFRPVGAQTPTTKKSMIPSEDYHIHRSSLKNVYLKMEEGRHVKVAFLGGSITAMRGWRYMLQAYFQERFPEAEFEFIQAGVPSMGSTSDAFRMERDVVRFGPVDLLFVEAAVNDEVKNRMPVEQLRGMEGIVRHARYVGPETDIVFMYFVDPYKIEKYRQGRVPEVIANHDSVAKYYDISAINLAREVTDRIDAGEFDWEHDFRNLHPSPFGQRIYWRSMVCFLEDEWNRAAVDPRKEITTHSLPEKMDQGCYDRGWLFPAWQLPHPDGWKYVEVWDPEYKVGKRTNYYHVPVLIGEEPGKVLKYGFEGNAVGIVAVAGPDEGIIEYRIDKGNWQKKDLFTKYSQGLYLPWYYTLGADLDPGRHTLEIRLTGEKNEKSKGTKAHIRYIFVNR
jgi:sialidase-1